MRKNLITLTITMAFVLGGCSSSSNDMSTAKVGMSSSSNVLLYPSPLQDHAPQFDKIKSTDYLPAFREGMRHHDEEIASIINNPSAADFENTISAMESSGAALNHVSRVFFALSSLMSNDEMQKIQQTITPELTNHGDNIYLNHSLFTRVEAVYQHRSALKGEQKRLTEIYYNNFLRAGAKLSASDQAKIRNINASLAKDTAEFSNNILESFKEDVILVQDKSKLDGLSADEISSLATAAKSAGKTGYMITLVNTTRQPILAQLTNRDLRQQIWQASSTRGMSNNGPLALKDC